MLELRPNCECCNVDLPASSSEAMICSFECTFCSNCARELLYHRCPNCGGELVVRPRRVDDALVRHPASKLRIYNPKLKVQSHV